MKLLLTIMILYFRIGVAQNCLDDLDRFCDYTYMEVLNPTTNHYEKYTKAQTTNLHVLINSQKKQIKFIDQTNNYDKIFTIKGCLLSDSTLTYECIDTDNNKNCRLIFDTSVDFYNLEVRYEVAPIVYRVRKIKLTN